ncbi:HDIG domain-containing protein [Tissierella carlieri]|jgi:putative nucleotidyltransferase with HDIG domain|uniref:HD family phosphohydrolase n=1 Tax=Tissierella carlieri TaxID=689904 RepID=UPI001C11685C|nr:HDIG domain-containing metalloprotein [Tissierella carlieri]MBU5313597.1 HDIG domain-containing protein [Tissierella carlieri]
MDNKKISITKNRRLYNGLLLVIFTAILFFITIHKLETNKFNLKIGDIATTNIRATKDLEDIYTTEKLKIDAMNKVEPRYRISPSVQMTMKNTIKDFLDTTRDIKAQESISINKKAHLLNEKQELGLSSKEIYIALRMDYKSLNNFENNLMDLINQVMGNGIKETELEYEKENLVKTFESLDMKDEEKQLGLLLMNATIRANEFLDKAETDRRKEEEAKKIETVILKENEIIASQGTTIGERELELIRESGLLKEDNKIPIGVIIGTVMLISLGMSIIVGYIYLFNNEILYNNRLLILLIIILSSIIICKEMYLISPYIMPVATAALLISMLIEPKLGLLVNMFLSFFLGFILRLDASTITMYMISGGIAALIAIKQEQRYNILLNGFIVGAINLLALTSFKLAKGVGGIDSVTTAGYSFLNGIIAAILTLGSLPVWENAFSVLTTLKLLELSNPNQPLLKKLLLEAPGTYHHSILVGNLSEAAAESISANPLLARVASYYHDIGKTIRPYYFAENQFGMENPHNKLQPMQSTTIITSHTIDGMALGKEKKLPKEIIDIIEEHHGNTAVAYFYYKAKELDKDIDISIDAFRYRGRKPQTKEAAIVMLADSSEAAVRSMKDLTKEKIEDMVRKVVQGKLKDEQLDECNVTLKEIEIIIHSFVNVLTGIYHDRIEYPNVEEKSEA